ncbi:hypothetical protein [Nocardioides nanhaiensis]|uniref:Uncharacterized protein n=1 Tax=Nocardioides nanhaiensis TaxID=1476871 RepID=A0ABP8W3D7_9ACTN
MKQTITRACLRSDRRRGMTLEDVAQAVQSAVTNDLPPNAAVSARVGWRGQVQAITITAGRDDA